MDSFVEVERAVTEIAALCVMKASQFSPKATLEQAEKEFFQKHRPTSLLQRMADESEVGSLVAYLASPLASATNGAAIRCEGGILRALF